MNTGGKVLHVKIFKIIGIALISSATPRSFDLTRSCVVGYVFKKNWIVNGRQNSIINHSDVNQEIWPSITKEVHVPYLMGKEETLIM